MGAMVFVTFQDFLIFEAIIFFEAIMEIPRLRAGLTNYHIAYNCSIVVGCREKAYGCQSLTR